MKSVLYFTADWCQPCKKVKPIVEELNREHAPGMFQIIDVDIEKEMAKSFELKSVPTFVLFENGNEVNRLIGAQTKQSLLEFIGNE
jgi:thioredoxin-like negative regulator of GroEL